MPAIRHKVRTRPSPALIRVHDRMFRSATAPGHAKKGRVIEGKRAQMLKINSSRTDLAEKFQKLIDKYNSGSQNIETLFAELSKFARELTEEEQRGVAEGLSDEELALFDILTQPEPKLSKTEEADAKKVCRELLATLKREKLIVDWREKQQARAGVI